MRRMSRRVWRLVAGTITVALFTACSPDSPTTSPNPVLTQPEANAMAEVVATDAAALSQGATFDAATGAPFGVDPMMGAPSMPTSSATCTPTRSPSPPVNSDGDPVPDSVRVDFAGCTTSRGSYTANQAGSIQVGSRLPSGDWTIAGASTYTSGTSSYSLSVTTSEPLHYNPGCTTEPRFDSGKLRAVVTKGTTSTTVTIEFTACGQYTVTRS